MQRLAKVSQGNGGQKEGQIKGVDVTKESKAKDIKKLGHKSAKENIMKGKEKIDRRSFGYKE